MYLFREYIRITVLVFNITVDNMTQNMVHSGIVAFLYYCIFKIILSN